MTGTAMTEDAEFREIYKLPVVAIPPNRPVVRMDEDDLIYRTVDAKFNAVADDVAERHAAGQPCLIGTVSIEAAERLSRLLDKRGIKHETLNAKNHEREAHIIAQAGRVGAVTIATNMAGRGTDILLGGNPEVMADDLLRERGFDPDRRLGDEAASPDAAEADEERAPAPTDEDRASALAEAKQVCAAEHDAVIEAGGLTVIGTERHESRRIDNQLRGRSGRQGDPGTTQFYLSLEDDLMRLFGGNRMDSIARMMEKTDMPEDMPIQAGMVSKAIEGAQRQVESMHFAARKNVLEYDDVMNLQRVAIYGERNAILDGKDLADRIPEIIREAVDEVVGEVPREEPERRLGRQGGGPVGGEHDRPERLRCRRDRPRRRPGTACRRALRLPAGRVRGEVRHAGRGGRAQPGSPGDAAHHRHALDGAPPGDGLPEGGHRPARVRPARPLGGIQERGVQRLPEPDGVHVRGLPAHAFAPAGGRSEAARGREGPAVGPCRATRRPKRR